MSDRLYLIRHIDHAVVVTLGDKTNMSFPLSREFLIENVIVSS